MQVIASDRLLPIHPDTSERLGVGRSKTWELVRTGRLPSVRLDGRRLVRESDLETFIASLRVPR